MRDQRLSWIEETKRRDKRSLAGSPGDKSPGADVTGGEAEPQKDGGAFGDNRNDDDLYSLPQLRTANTGATIETQASSSGALFLPRGDDTSDDDFGAGPNDDELDALMDAGTAADLADAPENPVAPQERGAAPQTDDFEDEMEAMAGFGLPDW